MLDASTRLSRVLEQSPHFIFFEKPKGLLIDENGKTKYSTSMKIETLIEELQKNGPLVALAKIGPQSYSTEPFKLPVKVCGKDVYGWKPGSERIENGPTSSVFILGAQKDGDKEFIYYSMSSDTTLDRQTNIRKHVLSPTDSKIYVTSHKTFQNYVNDMYPACQSSEAEKPPTSLPREKWSKGSSIILSDSGRSYVIRKLLPEAEKYRCTDGSGRTQEERHFLVQFDRIFTAAAEGNLEGCHRVVEEGFCDFHAVSYGRFATPTGESFNGISPMEIARMNKHFHVVEFFQKVQENNGLDLEERPEMTLDEEEKEDIVFNWKKKLRAILNPHNGIHNPGAQVELGFEMIKHKLYTESFEMMAKQTAEYYDFLRDMFFPRAVRLMCEQGADMELILSCAKMLGKNRAEVEVIIDPPTETKLPVELQAKIDEAEKLGYGARDVQMVDLALEVATLGLYDQAFSLIFNWVAFESPRVIFFRASAPQIIQNGISHDKLVQLAKSIGLSDSKILEEVVGVYAANGQIKFAVKLAEQSENPEYYLKIISAAAKEWATELRNAIEEDEQNADRNEFQMRMRNWGRELLTEGIQNLDLVSSGRFSNPADAFAHGLRGIIRAGQQVNPEIRVPYTRPSESPSDLDKLTIGELQSRFEETFIKDLELEIQRFRMKFAGKIEEMNKILEIEHAITQMVINLGEALERKGVKAQIPLESERFQTAAKEVERLRAEALKGFLEIINKMQ